MQALDRNIHKIYLLILIFCVPVFDSLTGILVRGETMSAGGLGTPSQLIRFIIIGLSILLIQSRSRYQVLALASIYIISIEMIAFAIHQNIQGLLIGLVFSYKFIYAAFVFFALDKIIQSRQYSEKNIVTFIYQFAGFLCIVFIAGIFVALKLGISGSVFRTQGLFSSGNGLGILIGSLMMIVFYGLRKGYLTGRQPKMVYSLGLICLVLIATKASLIFLLVNLAFLLFSMRPLIITLFLLMVVGLVIVFWGPIIKGLNIAFELIIFRFEHKTSWAGFILSGRQGYLEDAFAAFDTTEFKLPRYIFGAGSFLSYESPNDYTLKYKMLEMDIFDTFFIYGYIGLFLYLLLGVYLIWGSFVKSRILGWCSLTIYMHSVIAGHTMYNGLSATAIVFLLLLLKKRPSLPKSLDKKLKIS